MVLGILIKRNVEKPLKGDKNPDWTKTIILFNFQEDLRRLNICNTGSDHTLEIHSFILVKNKIVFIVANKGFVLI